MSILSSPVCQQDRTMPTKTCNKCKIEKQVTNFCNHRNQKDGLNTVCRSCSALLSKGRKKRPEYTKQWNAKNKDKRKASNLKHFYGITLADYNTLIFKQKGKCAICNKLSKLNVDHCHTTGTIRGLLCNSCNLGIGNFKDSLYNLTSAYRYLFSQEPRSKINRESGARQTKDNLFRLEFK